MATARPPQTGDAVVQLRRLAHGRTGDKGNRSSISVIAHRPEFWPLIVDQVTEDAVRAQFAHRKPREVRRYLLPRLAAMNFVLDDVLDGGVNDSLNLDTHGKSLAFLLLAMEVRVPRELLALVPGEQPQRQESDPMPIQPEPFAAKSFHQVLGRRMACIDSGEGRAIVFQHGNPTSSYLWRNVMPHCAGLGRLVACDLIGMGDSDKLPDSGPERYTFAEHRAHLDAFWETLSLGDGIVLVLHDWGSALGFDWARRHADRVAGIVYMESIVTPVTWDDWPENARRVFQGFRTPGGEDMVLAKNVFVERVLPGSVMRPLAPEEMAEYRRPFAQPGEDRRPTLTWPRQIPIDGEPADVVRIVEDYSAWLAKSPVPKLFINAEPGSILTGRPREVCRAWPNQTEITVRGTHFIQEDSPDEIGLAVAGFVRTLKA
jgi:haloalkane dehalogenase